MKIGLIDVDGHNFPNLAVMKISAYHKARGDHVEWWDGLKCYDLVYKSKVFTDEYSPDECAVIRADKVIRGGTGYDLHNRLPEEIEHIYPDYSIYPKYQEAYGFLTRGCPRSCPFCIVAQKEGLASRHVADLSEFWRGQKVIKLLDPNILACPDHERLLRQLADSGAWVDFTQGLDIRLTTPENIKLFSGIKTKMLHFAWDNPDEDLIDKFKQFNRHSKIMDYRKKSVYVLTNFNSSLNQDLYRIDTLRGLGFDPYVMIYDKPSAPQEIKDLQRWCNAKWIFQAEPDFKKYRRSVNG